MLDFQKLMVQIQQVGRESLSDRKIAGLKEREAELAFEAARVESENFARRLLSSQSSVAWPVPTPLEPFGQCFPVAVGDEARTVVATDGSQIMPSHHQVHNCYLINIGEVAISYGLDPSDQNCATLLDSTPLLFHRNQDLYPLSNGRRLQIDELYVSLERHLLELERLSSIAVASRQRALPVVALMDGPLIPWSIEKMDDDYQNSYYQRLIGCLERFKEHRIPLIGYLSQSRSTDLVNSLRVWICPYEVSRCQKLCGHLNEEDFPCSTIWPLNDRQLLKCKLPPAHRTGCFLSGTKTARRLPRDHRLGFAYLNNGEEIARMEMPCWVMQVPELLGLSVSTVLSQSEKGQGYPITLAEAHNLAVIQGADRTNFFEILTDHLVRLGYNQVKVSPKEWRKRKGII